ncbi:hypothetical protein [Candidatus Kuenenia stuttgartiensis]
MIGVIVIIIVILLLLGRISVQEEIGNEIGELWEKLSQGAWRKVMPFK